MTTSINAAETLGLSLREEVAIEIRAHMDSIGTSYLTIGKALNEVREDFETAADFLSWTQAEFGLGKAQAYNLMKVSDTFGNDARFKGVAMRVLMVLARHVEDDAVMTRAAAKAASGDLDSKAIADILAPAAKAAPVVAKQAPNMAANDGHAAQAPEVSVSTLPDEEGVEVPEVAQASPVQDKPANADVTTERERGLISLVQSLRDVIAGMQEDMRKMGTERDSKVKAAPMLPQFKSKCLYARLGLSAEEAQDAKAVKKAQRELVKLGYGEGHAAWAAISEAVIELTGGAK